MSRNLVKGNFFYSVCSSWYVCCIKPNLFQSVTVPCFYLWRCMYAPVPLSTRWGLSVSTRGSPTTQELHSDIHAVQGLSQMSLALKVPHTYVCTVMLRHHREASLYRGGTHVWMCHLRTWRLITVLKYAQLVRTPQRRMQSRFSFQRCGASPPKSWASFLISGAGAWHPGSPT